MDPLLTKQNIHVGTDQDHVVIQIGRLYVDIPYAASFKIAQALRLSAKDAMRFAHENIRNAQFYSQLDEMPEETSPYHVSKDKRITVRGNFNWATGWDGEMVKVKFGNNIAKFHFEAALKISTWLINSGKKARSWAGDSSRSMIMAGHLHDAEFLYKHGVK